MLILLFWATLAVIFIYVLPASWILFVITLLAWAFSWGLVFKTWRYRASFFLTLLLLVITTSALLQTTVVQNWLVGHVSHFLSNELKTTVQVKHVEFGLFNKMLVQGVLVTDRQKDTLLSAGTLKVNITDWFFFKDKPTLQYIGLSDAVVNMNRSDSVWNYQFIVDYFSSPKKSSGKKNRIEIDLKKLDLQNIVFNRIDQWRGEDMKGSLKKLYLSADSFDFAHKKVAIGQVDIENPVFGLYNYPGKRPAVVQPAATKTNVTVPGQLQWNPDGWELSVAKIVLKDGTFINEKETERLPYTDRFDGQHIRFAAINGELNNILFAKDTITAAIKLSTTEKSGFTVNQLSASLKITPGVMEFSKLDIITGKSRIGNYYAMRYNDFNEDMSDFLHSVKLEGHFDKSKVSSDDIAYFAPQLKTWKRLVYLDGDAKGSIDNLVAKNFTLKTDNSFIAGDISLRGLPDIYSTFIDFKSAGSQTNYRDIAAVVPSLKRAGLNQLSSLGNIRFKGNFTGFLNDFVAYGNISTSLGNLNADLNMKLPEGKTPSYSGKISSAGFLVGRLFNNNKLGSIALNGTVKGSGFTQKTLNLDFDGKIQQLNFSGYNYRNITLNGKFVKSLFNGHLNIDDPNLKIDDLDGSVSLRGDSTTFNFTANLRKANLQQLNLTAGAFSVSGLLNFDFKGNNIDNFLGTAKMYNATFLHDSTRLSFDYLNLNSFIEAGKKTLSLESNEVTGSITGRFKILELPDAFNLFLNRYYPAYFKDPRYNIKDQDFTFLIKTKEVSEYVKLFDKRLSGFDNAVFSGSLRLAENEFNINATIPAFTYDGKRFDDIELTGRGNRDSLNTVVSVRDVAISDSLHFPNTRLTVSSSNDISNIQLSTSASKTLSDAQLNAQLTTYGDGVKIHLSPSSFILNDKKWDLAKDGEITLRRSLIEASDVRFTQGNQEIVISTEADKETGNPNLVAKLKTVNINDFTQLFLKQPRLEGLVTGTLTLRDPFGQPVIDFEGMADEFRLDNKELGTVTIKGRVNTSTGLITANADALGEHNKFSINGTFNYKDSAAKNMNIALQAEKFDISILDNYLGAIFSNMKGNINTNDLRIYSGDDHNFVTGTVNITEGELKVKYTQVKYKFSNETIIFNPDEIDFGLLQLKDTLNNTGTASGKMQHRFFTDFGFDNIRFETGKMLLLNTSKRDNSQFYGKVIGRALMTLNGPITDMRMNISGEPSAVDSSHIFIPTGSSQEYGKIDYIDFIQYGSKMEDEYKGAKESNFLVNMNLTANPACKIDVILDETTGDIIKGRGNGLLNITVGTKEPLSIRGRYDIADGEYKFNFQTFLQKYFSINSGSSITWNGDPYEAQININAEYLAPNVDLSSLATSRGKYRQKSDLLIVAHLTNTLKAPKIAFEFVIPENKQTENSKDPVLVENLKKFSKDENEQNRQVASLLLFNTFINDNNGGFGSSTVSFISGTAGQVISGFLNNQLTRVFQKLFKDPTITPYISFNSNYNLTSTELINALEASGNFGFKKAYINGRLVVSLGGNIDYNNPYILAARNTNVLLTPDITVEYLLTQDGKLRIVGFNRTVVDATLGQRNRTGLRLSYSRDFDKLSKAERMAIREEKKKKKRKP